MAETDFREDRITITREEFSTVISDKVANFHKNIMEEYKNKELGKAYNDLLIAFGAALMTALFDEGKVEDLEIGE